MALKSKSRSLTIELHVSFRGVQVLYTCIIGVPLLKAINYRAKSIQVSFRTLGQQSKLSQHHKGSVNVFFLYPGAVKCYLTGWS